jgi:adenylate cyclase
VFRQLVIIEAARSVRERPDHPDVIDLILQARAETLQPPSPKRHAETLALYERALRADPTSVMAMVGVAETIMFGPTTVTGDVFAADLDRAKDLTAAAQAIAPMHMRVFWAQAFLLRFQQRWPEAAVSFERLLRVYPQFDGAVYMLGICKVQLGQSEDAIPLFRRVIRDDPHDPPEAWTRYFRLGHALLFTGRYNEAV